MAHCFGHWPWKKVKALLEGIFFPLSPNEMKFDIFSGLLISFGFLWDERLKFPLIKTFIWWRKNQSFTFSTFFYDLAFCQWWKHMTLKLIHDFLSINLFWQCLYWWENLMVTFFSIFHGWLGFSDRILQSLPSHCNECSYYFDPIIWN